MLEIVIEEVTGPRRKIILRGQSLPETKDERPVIGGTTARGKVNTPPGNHQADIALSSAVWQGTTLQGRWSDRFMWDDRNAPILFGFDGIGALPRQPQNTRNASAAASAATGFGGRAQTALQVVQAFQTLNRGLQTLRFTWGPLSYYGILREFTPRWKTLEDVLWEARFDWTGDTITPPKIRTPKRIEAAGLVSFIKGLYDGVSDAFRQLGLPARLYQQVLQASFGALTAAVTSMIDSLQKLVIGAFAPTNLLDDLRASLLRIQLAAQDLARRTTAVLPQFGEPLGPRDSANADYAILGLSREAERMAGAMAERERELAALSVPEILAAVVLGTRDLRDIATDYYGDPADWIRLMQYNGFTSSNLPPETVVLVPAKT